MLQRHDCYLFPPTSEDRRWTGEFQRLLPQIKTEPSRFPPSTSKKGEKKGRKVNATGSSGISRTDFSSHVRPSSASVILPRAHFAAAPRLLRPLPPGLTSHDDERTESRAATAEIAGDAASRPSVKAITFRPAANNSRPARRQRRGRARSRTSSRARAPAPRDAPRDWQRRRGGAEAVWGCWL